MQEAGIIPWLLLSYPPKVSHKAGGDYDGFILHFCDSFIPRFCVREISIKYFLHQLYLVVGHKISYSRKEAEYLGGSAACRGQEESERAGLDGVLPATVCYYLLSNCSYPMLHNCPGVTDAKSYSFGSSVWRLPCHMKPNKIVMLSLIPIFWHRIVITFSVPTASLQLLLNSQEPNLVYPERSNG